MKPSGELIVRFVIRFLAGLDDKKKSACHMQTDFKIVYLKSLNCKYYCPIISIPPPCSAFVFLRLNKFISSFPKR